MSRISIALATYNGEKYIQYQLESLLFQSRLADECIISDDCSTDRTVYIIEEFIRSHGISNWKLLHNDKNLGFIDNFRRALSHTTGNIVFLCDQDDEWRTEKIEEMASIIENNRKVLALFSSFSIIKNTDRSDELRTGLAKSNNNLISGRYRKNVVAKVDPFSILHANISPGCTAAFRREVIEKYLKIDQTHIAPHDWALAVIAGSAGGLYFWNRPTVMYRLHETNTIGLPPRTGDIGSRSKLLDKYKDIQVEFSSYLISDKMKSQALMNSAFIDFRVNSLKKRDIAVWISGLFLLRSRHMFKYLLSYFMDLKFILKRG